MLFFYRVLITAPQSSIAQIARPNNSATVKHCTNCACAQPCMRMHAETHFLLLASFRTQHSSGYRKLLGNKTGNARICSNSEARSYNHCCRGKCVCVCSHSYPACKTHTSYLLSPVACPTLPQFSIYFINGMIFIQKLLHILVKCVLIFCTTFV